MDDQEKLSIFKQMLLQNHALLKSWLTQSVKATFEEIRSDVDWEIRKIYWLLYDASTVDRSEFVPSVGFSVAAATLGSNAVFDRHTPQTLDDCFTLIHQDQLAILAVVCEILRTLYKSV